jgi:hypothetical protein
MNKRFMNRKAGKVLAAAAAVVGFAVVATPRANASLEVDLRIASVTGTGGTKVDSNHATVAVGDTVTMDVIARLTGQNSVQIADTDFTGDGTNDTHNDDSLQILVGSFKSSTGGLLGDLQVPFTVANWKSAGFLPGTQVDTDGDTDLDVGNATSTDPVTMWNARAGNPTFAVNFGEGGNGYATGSETKTMVISPTTSELHMGTVKFVVTGSGGSTDVNFVLRPQSSGANSTAALWFEDGDLAHAKDPYDGTGTFILGSPVTITSTAVPEPASLGLLGLLGAGLVSRRRRKA